MITIGKIDFDALRQQVEAEFAQEQSEKQRFRWTQELTDRLIALVDEQKTVPDIAAALGVPEDKVRNKLQVLKARVPSAGKADKPKTESVLTENAPNMQSTPVESDSETSDIEPDKVLDRVIFAALDKMVGEVDDFGVMSGIWRAALETMERYLKGVMPVVRQHPATESHFAAIAAAIAYDDLAQT